MYVDRRDSPLGSQGLQRCARAARCDSPCARFIVASPSQAPSCKVLKAQILHLDAPHQGGLASPHSIQDVSLALPLDLLQDVERLALQEDWSTQAWLRDAIETQVRQARQRLGLDESVA